MGEALAAEPARLERVIAVRQPRIGVAHGRHQRLHHLALDPVGEMPRVGDVGKAAPAVGNLLVLGERVGDEREGAQVFAEGLGQRLGGGPAGLFAAVLEQVERRLDRQRLGADLEPQAGDGVVEQPVPGALPGHRLLVEQLLDAILELIGLLLADILDPGTVMAERGIGHRALEHVVVDLVELERKEQEMRGRGRDLLLHVAEELGAGGVGGVAGVDELGEGGDAAHEVVDRFQFLDGGGERPPAVRPARQPRELALVALLEGVAVGIRAGEVALDLRRADPCVKRGEVPFRQGPERGRLR